jgi:hypothetical protein
LVPARDQFEVLGNAFLAAELGDAVFAAQATEDDEDLLLS